VTLFLAISALLLCLATVLPISQAKVWWVRVLDFPRLQIALLIAAWLLMALCSLALGWRVSIFFWVLMLVSLIYQLWWIYPNSPLHRKEVVGIGTDHKLPEITLLVSNVLMDNRDSKPLISLIENYQPHLFATLESDSWWQQQLDTLSDYPHRLACALDNKYGMHVYSRIPIIEGHVDFLVEDDIPSMSMRVQLEQQATVRIHIVHPTPPVIGENLTSTERDVELLVLANSLNNTDEPTIVTGDLNDVAWSKTTRLFRRISGLLDLRTGRGMFNTFNAKYWFVRWPLDHIFVSSHFRVVEVDRLPYVGSDHFPVFAKLALGSANPDAAHLELEDVDHDLVDKTLDTTAAKKSNNPSL